MASAKKEQVLTENLYEIPVCTICLQELSEDMGSLDCGHVFHIGCISQHFEYRGTCPNCQKRACLQEIRSVLFPLTLNSKANSQLHSILAALEGSERKQVEHLLREVKQAAQSTEKLKASLAGSEKELATQVKVVEGLREELGRVRRELQALRKENLQLDKNSKGLSQQLSKRDQTEVQLRVKLDKYIESEADYEKLKKCRKIAMNNTQEIVKFKEEMDLSGKPPQDMAKMFFDMLLMKSLEVSKLKNQIKDTSQKDIQIWQLNRQIENKNAQIREKSDKYDELKKQFIQLKNKTMPKGSKQVTSTTKLDELLLPMPRPKFDNSKTIGLQFKRGV